MPTQIKGVHPYAEKFPMLPEAEMEELADSISVNGLRLPIVVTPDGLILDGRNRWKACELAEVDPATQIYRGDDLAEYVIDANATRRNMKPGARAMASALVLAADGQRIATEAGGWQWSPKARIQNSGTSGWQEAMRCAGIVIDYAGELAEQVINESLALDKAYRQACEARDAERNKLKEEERLAAEEADAKAFLEANAPDIIAELLKTGVLRTYAEVKGVWEQRNRDEAKRLKDEQDAEKKRLEEEQKGRADLYGGIARAIMVLSGYGGYDDVPKLMAAYDRGELRPPQLGEYLELQHLLDAERFITQLVKWSKA
jgi:ParB-like chromosome segregation protein Spo0J